MHPVKPTVPTEEDTGANFGVRRDQEIRQNARPWSAGVAILSKSPAGRERDFRVDGFNPNIQLRKSVIQVLTARELGRQLSINNLANDH